MTAGYVSRSNDVCVCVCVSVGASSCGGGCEGGRVQAKELKSSTVPTPFCSVMNPVAGNAKPKAVKEQVTRRGNTRTTFVQLHCVWVFFFVFFSTSVCCTVYTVGQGNCLFFLNRVFFLSLHFGPFSTEFLTLTISGALAQRPRPGNRKAVMDGWPFLG